MATYDYDPWGNQLSAEPTDSRIKGQPIRYAGYVYDSETKLYYLQARYYDPQTARFISRDPDPGDEDDPVTMNGYTYADDNPVMMTDPDGHLAQFIPLAVGGYRLYKGYKTYKKLKKGTHSVYTLTKGKEVVYVGRTKNLNARKNAHGKVHKDAVFQVRAANLTYSQARGLEHRYYLKYGGKKKLRNKIRPIAKKNKNYKKYMSDSRSVYKKSKR